MTTLFTKGIKAVEALPADRQDVAGALLLEIAAATKPGIGLTREQLEDVAKAVAEADRGEFASDEEIDRLWRTFGR